MRIGFGPIDLQTPAPPANRGALRSRLGSPTLWASPTLSDGGFSLTTTEGTSEYEPRTIVRSFRAEERGVGSDWRPGELRNLLLALNFFAVGLVLCAVLAVCSLVTMLVVYASEAVSPAVGFLAWQAQLLGILVVALALRRVIRPLRRTASLRARFAARLFAIMLLLFPDSLPGLLVLGPLAFLLEPVVSLETGMSVIIVLHAMLVVGSTLDMLPLARRLIRDFDSASTGHADRALALAWLVWLGARCLCVSLVVSSASAAPRLLLSAALILPALELAQVALLVWSARRVWSLVPAIESQLGRYTCPFCWYDLRGSVEPGCPECGWRRAA